MPLTDATNVYKNKENETLKGKLGAQLEETMRKPMVHKVDEIKAAVSIFVGDKCQDVYVYQKKTKCREIGQK